MTGPKSFAWLDLSLRQKTAPEKPLADGNAKTIPHLQTDNAEASFRKEKHMTDINSLALSGRLVRDPEFMPGENTLLATFTLAVNHQYKTRQGEPQKEVAFILCKTFGAWAKNLEGGRKGDTVIVSGRLRTESWESNGVKHQKLVVVCQNVLLVPRADKPESISHGPAHNEHPDETDDVPF